MGWDLLLFADFKGIRNKIDVAEITLIVVRRSDE